MSPLLRVLRRLSPTSYIKMNIAKIERHIHKLKTSGLASFRLTRMPNEQNSINRLMDDRREFEEWQQELDDKVLAKRAKKIGVYLDEIEFTSSEDNSNYGLYYCIGHFGNELFRDEFRKPLIKAIREREPVYRRERRELIDLNIRLITAVSGVLGTMIGLFAIIRK